MKDDKSIKGEEIISLDQACFAYEGQDANAVDHVTASVYRGEFLSILGHNGSGKSTLAKLLNALFIPASGKVTVCGLDTSDPKAEWEVRRNCGMVFQNPDNQLVATVVEEDVAFGLENIGVPSAEIRRRVDEALSSVGMGAFAASAPHMLSGGQKQRVAIAGVLAMRPEIIVFDEATAMLDPGGRRDVMRIVQKLNRQEGITVVWITHFMEEAALSDRVLVMEKGRVALEGAPREVFTRVDEVKALGLDVPEMAELGAVLRARGLGLGEGILTVDEMVVELCRLR